MNMRIHFSDSGTTHELNITESTTCNDLFRLFKLPTDGSYELNEYWRDCERSIKESENLSDVLKQWGPAVGDVLFILKPTQSAENEIAGDEYGLRDSLLKPAKHAAPSSLIEGVSSSVLDRQSLADLKGLELWQAEQIYMQQKQLQDKQQMLFKLSSSSESQNPAHHSTSSLLQSSASEAAQTSNMFEGAQPMRPRQSSESNKQQQNSQYQQHHGGLSTFSSGKVSQSGKANRSWKSNKEESQENQMARLKQEFDESGRGVRMGGSPSATMFGVNGWTNSPDMGGGSYSPSNQSSANSPQMQISNDNSNLILRELDSVRAMFSEKEKELSVAVAKVEHLTSQLESLKTNSLFSPTTATPSPPSDSVSFSTSSAAVVAGNNLVFDRMNSQILVRNMMNNENASKLESRKAYLGERVTELDSLHAKMKSLNDRINFIKQHQNVQDNKNDQQPSYSLSSSPNSSSTSARNQFAPVRRFDSRPNPPLIAQVHPMRSTPAIKTPSPNSDSSSSPRDEKQRSSPMNFLKPQLPQTPSPNSPKFPRDSRMMSGSPNAFLISDSPSISPNSSAMKHNSVIFNENVHNSKSISEINPDYPMKLAKVRPIQSENGPDLQSESMNRFSDKSSSQNNYTIPGPMEVKYSTGLKSPNNQVQNSSTFAQNSPFEPQYASMSLRNQRADVPFQTTKGSNSDSKSSGYVTAEDNFLVSDNSKQVPTFGDDETPKPVIHQYPILQQFVTKGSNGTGSLRSDMQNIRPSAYERLFPPMVTFENPSGDQTKGGNEVEELSRSRDDSSDGSRTSIFIDKTTKTKRRRSLVHADAELGLALPSQVIQDSLNGTEPRLEAGRMSPEKTPPKKVVGILKTRNKDGKPRANSSGPGGGQKRRVLFDRLALFLDAALEGDLNLVRQLFTQLKDPSAGNDEGITALHNAICSGHFHVVDFLVQQGVDVNAADSDGWTPLHCAASCNHLPMVKYLVQHGACIFARTFSDGETPAQKCEEQEPNYAACSQYLYGVQEKLGITNRGVACVLFEYDAERADELTVCRGDSVTVMSRGEEHEGPEWWHVTHNTTAQRGYLPRNILGLYPRVANN